MFVQFNTFGYRESISLENTDLQNVLKEIKEYDDTPVCSTPKANNYCFTSKANCVFDFSVTIKTDDSNKCTEVKVNENDKEESKELIYNSSKNIECNVLNNKSGNHKLIQKTKEIKDTNQITSKISVDDESYFSEEDCGNNKLSQKQKDDVSNRTILRSVKRFYLNLFKESNRNLKRKRFRNVKSNNFITALETMIVTHILPNIQKDSSFGHQKLSSMQVLLDMYQSSQFNEDFNNLVVFLFRFIGFKPKDRVKFRKEAETKGEQIQSCMYSYSHPKMIKTCEILEFKILFQYVYYYHLNSLFEKDKTLSSKRMLYMDAFHNMNKLITTKYSRCRVHKN